MTAIPVAAPGRWFEANRELVEDTISRVMESGQYILGPAVETFERRFAEFCGSSHAVAVASGTDALTLALLGLGVTEGEVITGAHTATATLAAIERTGATPVLADIDPISRCLCPASVERLHGKQTRAIVAVHIYGHPADMPRLAELAGRWGVPLVEDCSQAHGASIGGRHVGGHGIAGAFSFYPTKNIGAMGDAGAIVTNDDDLAADLRALRQYGWNAQRESETSGLNSRMDEIQAAILLLKLPQFPRQLRRRRAIANRYLSAIEDSPEVDFPGTLPGHAHAFHLFVVESDTRDELAASLGSCGVATARHYPSPVHRQPAYRNLARDGLAETERLYRRMLTIPLYPELKDEEIDIVCDALRRPAR